MSEQKIVTIPRINCGGCIKKVTRILQSLPGVEVLSTDLPTKTVHIDYDTEQTSLATIKSVLAEAKYPVVTTPPDTSGGF